MNSPLIHRGLAVLLAVAAAQFAHADAMLGPTPYQAFAANSPFAAMDFSGGYFYLENFEDGALNTPGVTTPTGGGVNAPAFTTDSVDADDGVIDGLGRNGRSWYSQGTENVFEFVFDGLALGGLPTNVGIVWTDVGVVGGDQFGRGPVDFEAFDENNVSIGTLGAVLGDFSVNGQTPEDRFFGVEHASGISSITITMLTSNDWEIDHLQYGLTPEPSTLAALALCALVIRRR